jgi:hypothetical protein
MPDQVIELAGRGYAPAPDHRSRPAGLLPASPQPPPAAGIEAASDAEIGRRPAQYERGEVSAIDAEEAFAQARRSARRQAHGCTKT